MRKSAAFLFSLICAFYLAPASAQLSDTASWTATVQNEFRVIPDITYRRANGVELKIDVYQSRNSDGPAPTFICSCRSRCRSGR